MSLLSGTKYADNRHNPGRGEMSKSILFILIFTIIGIFNVHSCENGQINQIQIKNIFYQNQHLNVEYLNKGKCHIEENLFFDISANGVPYPLTQFSIYKAPFPGQIEKAKFPIFHFKITQGSLALVEAKILGSKKTFKKRIVILEEKKLKKPLYVKN